LNAVLITADSANVVADQLTGIGLEHPSELWAYIEPPPDATGELKLRAECLQGPEEGAEDTLVSRTLGPEGLFNRPFALYWLLTLEPGAWMLKLRLNRRELARRAIIVRA
jgi:hypothetical protein